MALKPQGGQLGEWDTCCLHPRSVPALPVFGWSIVGQEDFEEGSEV